MDMDREQLFLSLFQKIRSRIPAPNLRPWIFSMPDIENQFFALFLRELCGDSHSGKKIYDAVGPWENARSLLIGQAPRYQTLHKRVGHLTFRGHRKIFHEKYIFGDPPDIDPQDSSLYKYCNLILLHGSQRAFYNRDFNPVFSDLKKIPGCERTFAFDLIESIYRNLVPNPSLRPAGLCLQGSTGPLRGFNLLYLGERTPPKEEWRSKITRLWGSDRPVWDVVESQGKRLVQKAEENVTQERKSTEFVVFEMEDLICNYQKTQEFDSRPDAFLKGELSLDGFAGDYLSVFGRHV